MLDADEFVSHLYTHYQLDFRLYAHNSLERRMERLFQKLCITTITELDAAITQNTGLIPFIINELAVGYTVFFRDAEMWPTLAKLIKDKNTDHLRIWVAGCSTGEEVYSITTLLQHLNFKEKVYILATDLNEYALHQARTAAYPLRKIELAEQNLKHCNLPISLEQYYQIDQNNALFKLPANIEVQWQQHNLINEDYSGVFDIIYMRNLLIYFSAQLQEFVLRKVHKCMHHNSFLVLGKFEAFPIEKLGHKFSYISSEHNILVKE